MTEATRAGRLSRYASLTVPIAVALATQVVMGKLGPVGFGDRAIPLEVLAVGVVVGSLYGLVGVGMVLVWRSHRLLNLAQAQLGAVPAVGALVLVGERGWPYLPAVLIALVAAAALGFASERVVVRRFDRAPRLAATIATLGLAQVLVAVEILLPRWLADVEGVAQVPSTPWSSWRFTVGVVTFSGDHLLAIGAGVAVSAAVAVALRRTTIGLAVRAAATRPVQAAQIGVPVGRLRSGVWGVAAVASALAVVLRAPLVGFPIGGLVGPGTLLYGLAAATFARMQHPMRAMAGGISVGIVEQGAVFGTGRSNAADISIFVLLVIALIVQKASSGRGADDGGWLPAREVPLLSGIVAADSKVRLVRFVGSALVAAALVALPMFISPGQATRMTALCAFGVVALAAVIITGWSGQLGLGQVALSGVGAAAAGGLVTAGGFASDMFVVLVISALAGAVASVAVGIPAVRLAGPQLAITSLAFAFAVPAAMATPGLTDWIMPDGAVPRPTLFDWIDLGPEHRFTYVALTLVVVALVCVRRLRGSRAGRLIIAGRDDSRVVAAVGSEPVRVRVFTFATSGMLAGAAGAIIAWNQGVVEPATFSPQRSLDLVAAVVIGGISSPLGALVGVLWVFGLPMVFSGSPYVAALGSGVGVLAVLMIQPGGLAVIAGEWWRKLATRLSGHDPGDAIRGGSGESIDGVDEALVTSGRSPHPDRLISRLEIEPGESDPDDETVLLHVDSDPAVGATFEDHLDSPRAERVPVDAADAMLVVDSLRVDRGPDVVLRDVSFAVAAGESVALVGTNGAGKSTLLDAIAGGLRTRRGTVSISGVDATGCDPGAMSTLSVAVHPGARACFGDLTVAEHFTIATTYGPSRVDVADIYDRYPRLDERRDVVAGALSGGERHLLGFALAEVADPDLLFVDELSLGLAPETLAGLVETLAAFRDRGCTVVVVDQRVDHLMDVVDRAIFLERGEIRFDGSPRDLMDDERLLRPVLGRSEAGSSAGAPGAADEGASPALHVENLTVAYGVVDVLRGIALDVRSGEVVGVVGGNGAGKTTLLDAIAGDVDHGGVVRFGGVDITPMSPAERAQRGLGRSFQSGSGLDALTVRECLILAQDGGMQPRSLWTASVGLPAAKVAETDAGLRAELLAASAGLLEWIDTPSGDLSTGLRRRLELHMVAAHDPSVLLLDEPTSGVATTETGSIASLIGELAANGAAVVVVDHDHAFIEEVADRIIEVAEGRLVTRAADQVQRSAANST